MKRKKTFLGTAIIMSIALVSAGMIKSPSLKAKAQGNEAEFSEIKFAANYYEYKVSTDKYDKDDAKKILFGRQNRGQANSEHNTWSDDRNLKIVQGLANKTLIDGKFSLAEGFEAISGNENVNLFDGTCAQINYPVKVVENGLEQNVYEYDRGENGYDNARKKGLEAYSGMSMDINFQKKKDGMIDVEGNNIEKISFTTDDDMWVYVDGSLVVDLGGVHSPVHGDINFNTGQVSTSGMHVNESGNNTTKYLQFYNIRDLEKGAHTLSIYYLDRGGHNATATIRLHKANEVEETPTPSATATSSPSVEPSSSSSPSATGEPSDAPTEESSEVPSSNPSYLASPSASDDPIVSDDPEVSDEPTGTVVPSGDPSSEPTETVVPSGDPTIQPERPSVEPSEKPLVSPSPKASAPASNEPSSKDDDVTPSPTTVTVKPSDNPKGGSSDSNATTKPSTKPSSKPNVDKVDDDKKYNDASSEKESKKDDKTSEVTKSIKDILPKTGTIQAYVFYIVGGILIIGGISLFVIQRKKNK